MSTTTKPRTQQFRATGSFKIPPTVGTDLCATSGSHERCPRMAVDDQKQWIFCSCSCHRKSAQRPAAKG